jgi:hypothetical protein
MLPGPTSRQDRLADPLAWCLCRRGPSKVLEPVFAAHRHSLLLRRLVFVFFFFLFLGLIIEVDFFFLLLGLEPRGLPEVSIFFDDLPKPHYKRLEHHQFFQFNNVESIGVDLETGGLRLAERIILLNASTDSARLICTRIALLCFASWDMPFFFSLLLVVV